MLSVCGKAGGRVDPNSAFIVEELAAELNTLQSAGGNCGANDVPELWFGRRQFDRRKESYFIRIQLVSALSKLEWIKRVASHCVSESDYTGPLFWVWEVSRESIDKARALLKPKCLVPQVSVEQTRHWLINTGELKDENASRLFPGSPEDRYQHVAFAARRGFNYWLAVALDLFPKIGERVAITRFEPILKSRQARA